MSCGRTQNCLLVEEQMVGFTEIQFIFAGSNVCPYTHVFSYMNKILWHVTLFIPLRQDKPGGYVQRKHLQKYLVFKCGHQWKLSMLTKALCTKTSIFY